MKIILLILKATGVAILGVGLKLMLDDIAAHTIISDHSSNVFGFGLTLYTSSILAKALFQD